jgi:hypothetical protein
MNCVKVTLTRDVLETAIKVAILTYAKDIFVENIEETKRAKAALIQLLSASVWEYLIMQRSKKKE